MKNSSKTPKWVKDVIVFVVLPGVFIAVCVTALGVAVNRVFHRPAEQPTSQPATASRPATTLSVGAVTTSQPALSFDALFKKHGITDVNQQLGLMAQAYRFSERLAELGQLDGANQTESALKYADRFFATYQGRDLKDQLNILTLFRDKTLNQMRDRPLSHVHGSEAATQPTSRPAATQPTTRVSEGDVRHAAKVGHAVLSS